MWLPIEDGGRQTMASIVHQINLHNHKQIKINIQSEDDAPVISSHAAQRTVNIQLVRKMGLLITTGNPQLLIDEAKSTISWQVPFLVQPPLGDKNAYATGESACVDAVSGDYVLAEDAVQRIRKAAIPIINQLYPDMQAYLEDLKEIAKSL
jgi:hypothetical protein